MEQELSNMLMEMFILENGNKIKLMDMENIHILMERSMKECGKMICNMVQVLKIGLMEANIKEIMLKEEKKVKGA